MRTDIPSSILNAYLSDNGVDPSYKLTIYENRVYFEFEDLWLNSYCGFGDGVGIQATPLSQDMKYDVYGDVLITVYADQGLIKLGASPGSTIDVRQSGVGLATDDMCRPTVWIAEEAIYVTYYSAGDVKRATIDRSLFMSGDSNCVTSVSTLYTLSARCAVHAISATENILLWVNEGGIKVGYLNSTNLYSWAHRIMNPTVVYLDATDAHISALNFSSAIQYGGSIFVYLSRENGSVMGIERKSDGMWTDTFEPVPADLSTFKIANTAISPNGSLHMCGQFQRIDDQESFSSSHVYCLDLYGTNGRVFSLDRFTLFAQEDTSITIGNDFGLRYQIAFEERSDYDMVYFSDAGRYMYDVAPFWASGAKAESITIPGQEIKKLSGDFISSFTMAITSNYEYYINHPLIKVGNVAVLEIGARTETDYEFYQAAQCIVASIGIGIADAVRQINIGIVPESLWKSVNMTHPFYLEMQSKQSLNDDMDEFDNLYDVSEDNTLPVRLSLDFWTEGEHPPDGHGHGEVADYLSGDIKELGYEEYPEIKSLPLEVHAYGWSRAGGQSLYTGGGDDPSDSASPNDNVTGILVIERDDVESTIYLTNVTGNGYWPQTWDTGAHGRGNGALPVIINARTDDGLAVGDRIKKVGIRLTNPSTTDDTYYYSERVEMPGIWLRLPHPVTDTWKDVSVQVGSVGTLSYVATGGIGMEGMTPVVDNSIVTPNVNGNAYEFSITTDAAGEHGWIVIKIENQGVSSIDGVQFYAIVTRTDDDPSGLPYTLIFWESSQDHGGYTPDMGVPSSGTSEASFPGDTDTMHSPISGSLRFDDEGHFVIDVVPQDNGTSSYRIDEVGYWGGGDAILWSRGTSPDEAVTRPAKELQKIGVPKVLFATKPYSTFNFSAATMCTLTGDRAWGGVVGIGKDGKNYLLARMSGEGVVEIAKVVDDTKTTLATGSYTPANPSWIMFEHRDGDLRVFIRSADATSWPTAPDLEYTWTEEDGVMSQDGDLMHVGAYALRDAPYVRMCGFDMANGQTLAGVLPPAENFSLFPSTGSVNINGVVYSYTSLVAMPATIRGPFQGRNTGLDYSYTTDGESYSGNAIEFTNFEWLTNSSNHDKYAGLIMNLDSGFGWLMTETDFKPTIRTSGVTVNIRNRSRNYATGLDGDNAGWSTKIWLTGGFSGMSTPDGKSESVSSGDLAFLVSDTEVVLSGFAASSGNEDATVEDLIDRLMRLCGGSASFPGDTIVASHTLSGTEWTVE